MGKVRLVLNLIFILYIQYTNAQLPAYCLYCPSYIWYIVRWTRKRRRRRFRESASIFRLTWISLLHNVLKRVRNRIARFPCVFGNRDDPLNFRRIPRIWLYAYLPPS